MKFQDLLTKLTGGILFIDGTLTAMVMPRREACSSAIAMSRREACSSAKSLVSISTQGIEAVTFIEPRTTDDTLPKHIHASLIRTTSGEEYILEGVNSFALLALLERYGGELPPATQVITERDLEELNKVALDSIVATANELSHDPDFEVKDDEPTS